MWSQVVITCLLLSTGLKLPGASEAPQDKRHQGKAAGAADTKPGAAGGSPASVPGPSSFLGKLLVVPMDGSHWIGIKAIAQEMGRRGHQVTVVIPEISIRMGPGKHYHTVTHPVPYGKEEIDSLFAMHNQVMNRSRTSFMESIIRQFSHIQKIKNFIITTAESLLFNASLISHLSQQSFDAVLTDPFVTTGSLIAKKLGLPTVNLLRGMPCSLDMKSTACPSPPSYVPRLFTGYIDKMSFKERCINTLVSVIEPLLCRLLYWRFEQIAQEFLEQDISIAEVLSESAMWLMRVDFTLEFPRPLMPNMVQVGGINCNVRNPLPEELDDWVFGPHGFVVFTLGTMHSSLPGETTAVFLEAFRQIPQKVIWRYSGAVEDRIPDNVKLMEWVPQNDLLAHRGVRAFITHSGSHGIYEGLCHAVPMLMLPLGGDQPDNANRMASRGVGLILDIHTITVDALLQGLDELINNTRYQEAVRKLSVIHKDRPIDPLDLSVYWTEFVMRHKGAGHLRPSAHDLNWVQYHSLDVAALLVTVGLVVVIVTVKCTRLCFGRLTRVEAGFT